MKNNLFHFALRSMLLFLFLLATSELCAEATISLNELIETALQNNKSLKAAKHNVDIAKARLIQAGQFPNPKLNAANSDDKLMTNEGEYSRSIGISQEFPIAGRIGNQEHVAQVDIEIAQAEIKDAERKLKGEVASAFYKLLIINLRIQKIEGFQKINDDLVQVTKKRYQAAEVSELDVNSAQIEQERLLQERNLLEAQRVNQIAELNEFLGKNSTCSLMIKTEEPFPSSLPALEDQVNVALCSRPDLQNAILSMKRAKADTELAEAQKWEDWTVGVGYERDKTVVQGAPPQNSDNKLSLNVSIPLPLLNQNQGRIAETSAQHRQSFAKIEALKLAVQTEVEKNYLEVQSLQNALERSQKNSIKLGQKNSELAQKAYLNGLISFLEVVSARRQQYDIELLYLNTLDQYLQSYAKLQTSVGDFCDK